MILHYVEAADGTVHVHAPGCEGLKAQLKAGLVFEIDVEDEDDALTAVWEEFLGDLPATEEELDTFAEITVFRSCADSLFPEEEDEDLSGNERADTFMDDATEAGWDVEFAEEEGAVLVTARRGTEVIEIAWEDKKILHVPQYGIDGGTFKNLRNESDARKTLEQPPPQPASKQASTRQVKRAEPVKRELKVKLPFDIEDAYDDEILKAVQGRRLIWWNTISESYEDTRVTGVRHNKIETGTGGRAILTFISPEGFRSVALEELVQVR